MTPTTTNIHGFLSNPAYAGAFVYGRRQNVRDGAEDSPNRVTKPMEEWTAIHHGVYPATKAGRSFWPTASASGRTATASPRTRAAPPEADRRFWPALLVCGHCGRRMSVVYGGSKGHGGYVCNALPSTHGARSCLYVPRMNTDEAVVEAFFEAIRPSELDPLEETLSAPNITAEHSASR